MNKIKEIMPGFLVCLGIALLSKAIALLLPTLGAATFAIFIGIFLGNTIFKGDIYNKGSKFSESELLAYSVVLMGATLNLSDIASVGVKGVLFIILQMILTITATYITPATVAAVAGPSTTNLQSASSVISETNV